MPAATQDVLIVVTAVAAIAIFVYVLRELRGDAIPLYVFLGGFLVILYEPLGDILLGAYYPEVDQITSITAFGRDMPLFMLLIYAPFIVPFVLIFLRLAQNGFTRRTWWILWGTALVGNAAMEMIVIQFGGPWLYYGDQPFVAFDLPVWVVVTNVTFLFAIAATVYAIKTRPGKRHHWLALPAVPIMTVAGHASVALPAAAALQGAADDAVIGLGALASVAVAVVIAYALSLHFCRPAAQSVTAGRQPHPAEATAVLQP